MPTRAPMQLSLGLMLLAPVGAALGTTGCPATLVDNARIQFACERTDDCAERQVCRDGWCVAVALVVDASAADRGTGDAGPTDAIATDADRADTVRADGRPADAAGSDRRGLDVRPGDGAPDATLADRSDGGTGDGWRPDSSVVDSWRPDTSLPDTCVPPSGPGWWNPAYATRYPIAIGAAETDYTIELALTGPTASAVHAASLASGNDLRIVRHAGSTGEIDRERTRFDVGDVVLRFKIQEAGGYGGGDPTYFLYVGNATAGLPPANPRNVYFFYEDFEGMTVSSNGTPTFSPATAEWSVVDNSGNKAYRVNASNRSPAAIAGKSLAGAVFAGWVKYNAVNTGATGYTGLAFRCSDVSASTTSCTGGAVRDQNDRSGVMSWTNGTFDQFGAVYATFAPAAGQWYHYQVSFTAAEAGFWLNGFPQETGSAVATAGSALALVGVGVDAEFDDIFVRKRAEPAPTADLLPSQPRCQ